MHVPTVKHEPNHSGTPTDCSSQSPKLKCSALSFALMLGNRCLFVLLLTHSCRLLFIFFFTTELRFSATTAAGCSTTDCLHLLSPLTIRYVKQGNYTWRQLFFTWKNMSCLRCSSNLQHSSAYQADAYQLSYWDSSSEQAEPLGVMASANTSLPSYAG